MLATPRRAPPALLRPGALLGAYLALHVTLSAIGAVTGVPAPPNVAGALIGAYRNVSGAGETYGFFSPSIPDQISARLQVTDAQGRTRTRTFGFGHSEFDSHVSTLMLATQKLRTYDLLARTLATYALNDAPDAVRVRVVLTDHLVPSMRAARTGARTRTHDFYDATFTLKGDAR
ncbi:hypothetical protein [Deinococcus maricopensis]|uniref:Uncharacterized protein n=1 Tax=Deinococcus maricopensis (strain DSM 21211 / LMG 22137 / NRRL B-23946 / LB-34) TaxID=709986 RepID=E8UBB5_DEIML|nr:hypothetical protein [Deinococcus maricopensis]ADV68354.1 hypothetical protein Deima_2724 [Deinococcus maricopensis DSM 21211]